MEWDVKEDKDSGKMSSIRLEQIENGFTIYMNGKTSYYETKEKLIKGLVDKIIV
jgi:hypothetical protein